MGSLGLLSGKPGGTVLRLSFLELVTCLSLHQSMFAKTEIKKKSISHGNSLYILEFVFNE